MVKAVKNLVKYCYELFLESVSVQLVSYRVEVMLVFGWNCS